MIIATAEDTSVLRERMGGMERALMEQQARADQATGALQGLQEQQRQQAAQQAQCRAAAAQAAAHGGTDVVDSRQLEKLVAFNGRETVEVVQSVIRGLPWVPLTRRFKDLVLGDQEVAAMRSIHTDPGHPRARRTAVRHAGDGVPRGCVKGCATWKATVCAAAGTVSRRIFLVTRKRRCTSSTSCFADTARCQARMSTNP